MKLKELYINNFRSFENFHLTELSPSINVLIGKNNSGKSNILKSIASLQYAAIVQPYDIRVKQDSMGIRYHFDIYDFKKVKIKGINFDSQEEMNQYEINCIDYSIDIRHSTRLSISTREKSGSQTGIDSMELEYFSTSEPNNIVYFFPSNRKVNEISQEVTKRQVTNLSHNFLFLFGRIDNLLAENSTRGSQFKDLVKEILGFEISSISSDKGKFSCYRVDDESEIPIDKMGEGVLNILYLLTLLFSTKGSIFLIEELENDLHPEALKKLLNLILEKSSQNQFFITTHSHIVLKLLGADTNSKIFLVNQEYNDLIPTSTVELINNVPEERRRVLESLGYDLPDFDIAKYWILFEESSAERIFSNYLISWFAPKLKCGLKTASSSGAHELINKTKAINDLFLFLHLEPSFKERVWVIADGDQAGLSSIECIKEKFSSWDESHFINLGKENFELYYPEKFQTEVEKVLAINDKKERKKKKREILVALISWIEGDPANARKEFEKSATEIVQLLQKIEEKL